MALPTAAPTQAAEATAAAASVPDPVVHYEFSDDPSTGVIADSSGNGLNATLLNPGTATSTGDALRFSGGAPASGTSVRLPAGALGGAADMTVSMRLTWNDDERSWERLFDLGSGTSRSLFVTPRSGDGSMRNVITVNGAGGERRVNAYDSLPASQEHTVTVVLDATDDTMTLYLDGARVGTTATTITAQELAGGSTAGWIGRSFYPDSLLPATVDDFVIYDAALDADQVAALIPGTVPTATTLVETEFERRTTIGVAPQLPTSVRSEFTDSFDRDVPVEWDEVTPDQYDHRGDFVVDGTAGGQPVTTTVIVTREGEMTIDLGSDTGDFTGGAAGSLYGLYDDGMPTDNLVEGFGLQTTATKAQDGGQHPGSDALEILEPLARTTGGKVYIRPTDYYRGFPYQWPGNTPQEKLDDYFSKLQIQLDQIDALLATKPDLVDSIVIEPFNEPEGNMFGTGQWSLNGVSWLNDPTDYFAAWDKAYRMIREHNPDIPIAGPNTSVLFNQVRGFLVHTKEQGTVPDIVTWHELSDPASVRRNIDRFRGWEDDVLGTESDLPINIDEYAFNYHTSVPGQMIQWISALEEKKADGMIAFWNLNGNLTDSAVKTNRGNGQWWLYNAYTRMTGHTVSVSPPQPDVSYTLQGTATYDSDRTMAKAIIGGKSGDAFVAFDNVPDALGGQVRANIEEIPWTGQLGDSTQPRHVADIVLPVQGGSVSLDFGGDLPDLVESSAYQITLTPVGASPTTEVAPTTWQQTYEAEDAGHTGSGWSNNGPEGNPNNVGGFYTSNFRNVGGLRTDSDVKLNFSVDVPEDGTYDLQLFTSTLNTFFRVADSGPTNVFLSVDGDQEQELFLPLGYKWVVWDHTDTTVDLTAGDHTITVAAQSLDGTKSTVGDAIVDRMVLSKADPSATSSVYEAEYAQLDGATAFYGGDGSVSGPGGATLDEGKDVTFWVYSKDDAPAKVLVDSAGGTPTLQVNGRPVLLNKRTGTVTLSGGVNKVVVSGTAVALDRIVVTPDSTVLPGTTYQAESATLAGDTEVVDLSLAAGGKAVDQIGGAPGNGNTVTFDVRAAKAGPHAVTIRFSNPEQVPATHYNPNPVARHADISVNGELVAPGTMFVPTFHENQFWERTVVLDLAKGANAIEFRSEEEPNWDQETYASNVWGPGWPGLVLRDDMAPVLDQIVVRPFAAQVKALAPTLTARERPSISGVARVGGRLRANPGTWGRGVEFTYRWLRNGDPIRKAVGRVYRPTVRDKGDRIRVRVTGLRTRDGAKGTATSKPVRIKSARSRHSR
ncbi:LamG-like jellyroll fold domain-containing protein [Nocardioides bruguierae]|uniref:LamG-like jellyroll fold domain-containing protein n=1 Tax=Nocardioides bruguierae TaxID=2945102 RepID=UPI0020204BF9|nr:LamG-like jellyroll fold domain-containing protein [Nocardioides bruguierae]MCL8026917.1 Ig-like domain-containing protein [Nocardioides bruguierae]